MKDEEKQRQFQGMLAQMELHKNRMESLAGQVNMINAAISEMAETKKALAELAKGKKDAEILVPLGSGSYIKARVADTDSIIVGVGAGVSIEKKIPAAEEILGKREGEYTKTLEKIKAAMTESSSLLNELNDSAEKLAAELQAQQ